MAITLFIDTNIWLSFFHFSTDDLEELRKLVVLIEHSELRLLVPNQVIDEFRRNRESKIADALRKLKEQKLNLEFPQICKDYEEYAELRESQKRYAQRHAELIRRLTDASVAQTLRADEIINALFTAGELIPTSEELIQRARQRVELGNPPGKNGSLGDALNWEAIRKHTSGSETLHLVTGDKDYASPLNDGALNGFLLREWRSKKQGQLFYYRTLSEFFKVHFPSIKLAGEIEKELLITKFANSSSYAETHALMPKLRKYTSDFTFDQVERIAAHAVFNTQIAWILSDDDVEGFVTAVIQGYEDQMDQYVLGEIERYLAPPEYEHPDQ